MHARLSLLPSLLVCLAGSIASGQTFRILPPLEGYRYAQGVRGLEQRDVRRGSSWACAGSIGTLSNHGGPWPCRLITPRRYRTTGP